MAATLSLDTLTSSGSGITVATGKTLTVGGVSVTAGSTNVQRATTDVTIGTTTSKCIKTSGFASEIIADEQTYEGISKAIINYYETKNISI